MTREEIESRMREIASEMLSLATAAEQCGMGGMVEAHAMTNAYQEEFRKLDEEDDGYASCRVGGAGCYSFDGGRTWRV